MLKNDELFIWVTHYYPSENPYNSNEYTDLIMYNYNSNTITWDTTFSKYFSLNHFSFDTTHHFMTYIYDKNHVYDDKTQKWRS
ncbi:hypothetical protein OAQ99_01145 [Candidatus Kapabacteria bacterium]|nr:hypothetical protein [Candidatus Kapabacteria bacterium]